MSVGPTSSGAAGPQPPIPPRPQRTKSAHVYHVLAYRGKQDAVREILAGLAGVAVGIRKGLADKIQYIAIKLLDLPQVERLKIPALDSPELESFTLSGTIVTEQQPYKEHALLTLKSCYKALLETCPELKGQVETALEKIDGTSSASMSKKIKQAFVHTVKNFRGKETLKEFLVEVEKERAHLLPKTIEHSFTFAGQEFKEEATPIDNALSLDYLTARDPEKYKDEIAFLTTAQGGTRLSPLKKQKEVQGMLINGYAQTISRGNQKVATALRSGAFAVHGKGKRGLDRLTKEAHGKTSEKIKTRRDLCVAQALPKICAGIDQILSDPDKFAKAQLTGEFLYVEQSFLSTGQPSEQVPVEDMKGTLDYISKSVKVVLTNDATQKGVSIDKDGTIMLTMYHKGAAGGEVFGLQSLLFVQGVNEIQSFGRLINPKGIAYQDEVNLESLARLDAYAQNAGSEHILEALKNHYSEKTVRPGKDIEGVKLVRQAVKSLGGARGINCRAGKDRTAQEVNDDLAAEAVNTPQTAHHKDSIRQRLAGGISYTITGYNTGKANAYAFNKFQLPMLPAEWRPPAKYCGSEPT